jgi:K+-transporting ATPase KdpF subunit
MGIELIFSGIIGAFLLFYLAYSIIRPDKF